MTEPPLRAAASVVLVRETPEGPAVLMGMRGAGAAFMPSKYVFPGGAVDAADAAPEAIGPVCRARLARQGEPGCPDCAPEALAGAALRELAEETGLTLAPPPGTPALTFFFRAITPPGRPRRFDARFFLADARHLTRAPDDFSGAEDELSQLHWVPLAQARKLNLPFITEVVLAEAEELVSSGVFTGTAPEAVAFFDNSTAESRFLRIG